MRRLMAAALLSVLGACSAPPTYSGTVQTESITIGSQTGGRVSDIYVAAGSRVHRGSIVLRIDDSLLQSQYEQAVALQQQAMQRENELANGTVATDVQRAQAQSAAAQAQYQQVVSATQPQIAAQAAVVRDAQAGETLAQSNFTRATALAGSGDVSSQALDQARAEYQAAQQKVAQAQSDYRALVSAVLPGEKAAAQQTALAQSAGYQTAKNGPRPELIAQARANMLAAQAAVAHAQTQLRETVVRSPADGAVESFDLHPGDLLNPNQPVAVIDTFADPYVYIYASQEDLHKFMQGARVTVKSDAGMGQFDGVVEEHDRSAQFTPQNVETADQRAELVYGVKVRIHDPQHQLLDGTTVTVYPR
ncbi:MAG TPA: HlyD family efflux transporter periplasmic adaptor subunit [Candidatus Tumulicola sp.]